ncbi:MAG: helix-turn-helix transcriptional regulator [Saccharofermentanales bacterium]
MDWVKRINSVLDYIEQNLDGEIDENRISSLFASSQGVFQRVFVNITDTTLSEYIRKRRLTCAALDLAKTDAKIMDIAIKYGYNSAVAFSYAFKKFHGITPSEIKKSDTHPKYFGRLTFTNMLSEKGVKSMQYYNIENAEYFMQQMINKKHDRLYFQNISEHNGVKCACDGYRAAVILSESMGDWDFTDAYFDTNDKENPKFSLAQVFNARNGGSLIINLSKEQAAILLVSFDGVRTDHKRKFVSLLTAENNKPQEAIVCIDMNTMEIITEETALELKGKNDGSIIGFNIRLIEEILKFVMCSDFEIIEIYYNGNLAPLIMKSGHFYATIFPVKLEDK